MADREVRVSIKGSETVSDAAKKAEGGLSGLSLAFAKGQAIYDGVKKVLGEIGGFIKDAGAEAIRAEQTTAQLTTALARAGTSYDALRGQIDRQTDALVRLGFADDDVRDALTRMVTQSGDAQASLRNLSVVADLARDKNMSLADAGEIVGKAMAGNTTQLGNLYPAIKGTSDIVGALGEVLKGTAETHAATFGGALERVAVQFGEVKEAIGNALLGTSEMGSAATGLAGLLEGLAKWVEANEDQFQFFVTVLADTFDALVEVGKSIWDVVGPALTWMTKVAFVGLVGALHTAHLTVRSLAASFQSFAGVALQAIGTLVEKGGNLLKVFGIDVVQESGASLKKFGEDLVKNGKESADKAVTAYGESMGRLVNLVKGKDAEHTETVRRGTSTRTTLVKDANKEQEASELTLAIAREKAIRSADELFQKTKDALKKINLKEHKEEWEEIDRNVRLVKGDLSDLLPPAENLKQSIEDNNAALQQNAETAKDVKRTFADTVRDAGDLGRSLLDVGQASGIVSAEMAGVLNSVINIGTALTKIGVDPVGGMVGVISGLANIISGLGSSEAHQKMRAALSSNRDALERLTREVGNLNLGATGRAFAGTKSAIQATSEALRSGEIGPDEALKFFKKDLRRRGISFDDAKELFDELGFGGALNDSRTFTLSLGQISGGLSETDFGQFGQDFESSLESLQTGWDIFGVEDDTQKLSGLAGIARKFAPAIHTALMSANPSEALRDLFTQLQTGGLDADDFGDLTGRQFLDLLKLLIPLVDAVGFVPGNVASQGVQGGPKVKTGGLDPATEPGGLGIVDDPFDTSVTVPDVGVAGVGSIGSGASSNAGIVVTGNTFQFGPVTVDPDGRSIEDTGNDLAGYVAEQLARRLRDQAAAAGVPI